ncbi:MAG: acyl-CoA dehydrogenase family protein [Pseudomonadota bacterium]
MKGLDLETRTLVAQTLQRFVTEHYDPSARLHRLKTPPVDHRLHWPLLTELGVPGLAVSPDDGGLGGGAVDLAQALTTLAPGLVLEPVAEVLISTTLLAAGQSPLLAATLAGETIPVPVGLRPGEVRPRLDLAAGSLRLSGRCSAVAFAAQADSWLVAAQGAQGAMHLLAVPATQNHVRVSPYRLMDGRPAADLVFDAGALEGAQVVLGPGRAESALARASDLWLMACAADAVGIMEQLLNTTRDYLRTRIQFGVAIGTFQALQHRLADMQMQFLEARALLRAWSRALDADDPPDQLNALRRALPRVLSQAGRGVGQEAIQMHGGMGVTEELVVSHCNARLRVIASLLQAQVQATQTTEPEAA